MAAALPAAFFSAGLAARADMIEATGLYDLPPADVVILGEVHDNPVHHAHQALAVEAVGATALVFEMLTADAALRARPALRGDRAALERALGWADSGWPDFGMYYPIFVAAGDAPVFGADLPRAEVRRAVTDGAAEVLGAGASIFGLDRPLDPAEQATREAGMLLAHCNAMPQDLLPGMVEAQRLRDAALARAVLAAHAETGGPVAVIAGNGHARVDWGLPRMLARAAPDLDVVSVGQLEAAPDSPPPYDLWLVTDPVDRGDPCAGFGE